MSKINDIELEQMIRNGKTNGQMANHFNCSPAAVSQRKKKLQNGIVKSISLERSGQIIDGHLDMSRELQKINRAINRELERASDQIEKRGADVPAIQNVIVKMAGEIRKQIALQASFYETWTKIEGYQAFQEEILQLLEEVSPELRDELITRLRERRVLRGLVQPN